IKPYLPYVDCRPEATGGFAATYYDYALQVEIPSDCMDLIPPSKRDALIHVLKQDPRPSYQNDPSRIYGMEFAGLEVKFYVQGTTLTVHSIEPVADTLR
ncbi:MAG: hypothetical protein E7256_16535, partial [Lachnospiraceae bacterium]|nr:hypothetical protein [Lachnospiraceae bacterium]